ncbi:heavy metal translocating P-type ATPase [Sphingomonas sp.]|uniref:heavy metal translocating P-type ATPase n=1 Tax=Sphingomonas sp. TaxID=28214 RepID=UPI002DD64FA4|nr:cation-translocating P-type ATPase [Sphingomonas sp.]
MSAPAVAPAFRLSALHVRIGLVALGLLCLGLSVVAQWLRPDQADVMSLWAMLGLALAAIPVLIDSLTSLKADGFEATKYYMDQFVALAILACFAIGQYATGTIVAAILIVGQILEEHTTLGVEEAVNSLTRLARVKARRLAASGATEELVDGADLRLGDRVRVLPGDTVPADGRILSGLTTLDQATITGESLPVDAEVGSAVYAGTTNLTGAIEFEVTKTGDDTVIGRVKHIVEEAKTSRAPVMRLIDDYTRYYMPLVLIIAGFVLFFTREVERAIAVIIVAMPCAFVLASPSAMVAALAVASRLGILVKSSRFFEAAQSIDTVVFDKTGTLTTGQLRVVSLHPAEGVTENELLALAAALETHSTHPVARAILGEARRRGVTIDSTLQTQEVAGRGVRGGGLAAGRRTWIAELGVAIPTDVTDTANASSLYVARHGTFAGAILLADAIRAETKATAESLRALGIEEFVMLTGDREVVAREIAAEAGITRFRANCLPEQKLEEVRALKAAGRRVLVIGDGVNDAPALAAGDLGVAMGALGSDVAIKTADVALMGNDLRHLPRFIALSDRTLRIINQNLLWGLGFIGLFVALSAFGLVSPIVAAFLHEFSAFFVIFNSARLLRFDETAE